MFITKLKMVNLHYRIYNITFYSLISLLCLIDFILILIYTISLLDNIKENIIEIVCMSINLFISFVIGTCFNIMKNWNVFCLVMEIFINQDN